MLHRCHHSCPLPPLRPHRFIDAASRYYELSSISIRQLGDKAISEDDLMSESHTQWGWPLWQDRDMQLGRHR